MATSLIRQIEQKFFLRWTNYILYPDFQITSLNDLKDGFLLLKMTECFLGIPEQESESILLTDYKVEASTQPKGRSATKLSGFAESQLVGAATISKVQSWASRNITLVFNNCTRMNALIREVDREEILKGNILSIVDLLSAIANALHVQEITFQGVSGELALMQWVREICVGLVSNMKGFSGSWIDGIALCFLSLFPEKEANEDILAELEKYTTIERTTYALKRLANKGIPAAFDPPDLTMGLLSPRCMRVYVGIIHSVLMDGPLRLQPSAKRQRDYEAKKKKKEEHERERAEREKKMALQRQQQQSHHHHTLLSNLGNANGALPSSSSSSSSSPFAASASDTAVSDGIPLPSPQYPSASYSSSSSFSSSFSSSSSSSSTPTPIQPTYSSSSSSFYTSSSSSSSSSSSAVLKGEASVITTPY